LPYSLDSLHATGACAAAFTAGAINSVAGGGTLLTFPTLIWMGLDSVTANATSTAALWPASVGSAWGYRKELHGVESGMLSLLFPSLVGGLLGAVLLRFTPTSTFDRLVPFLILFATLLFIIQHPLQRLLGAGTGKRHHSPRWFAGAAVFQFAVGVYGGYFGAGIGILMLAAFSILGLQSIHEMNALKVVFAGALNAIAAFYFMWARMVYWPYVLLMLIAGIAGGYLGAGAARRLGQRAVRVVVILVGLGMAVSLFFKK
jgi:uncharacterized membrane protein YfcA